MAGGMRLASHLHVAAGESLQSLDGFTAFANDQTDALGRDFDFFGFLIAGDRAVAPGTAESDGGRRHVQSVGAVQTGHQLQLTGGRLRLTRARGIINEMIQGAV
jgi:hypothetical protein